MTVPEEEEEEGEELEEEVVGREREEKRRGRRGGEEIALHMSMTNYTITIQCMMRFVLGAYGNIINSSPPSPSTRVRHTLTFSHSLAQWK